MGNSGKAAPSGAWFILPCLLLLTAVVLAGLGISSFVHFVESDFRAVDPGTLISATKDGFTLYTDAEAGAIRPADLRCTATGPEGTVQLQRITGRTTLGNGQSSFVALASTPADLPAGRYVISCVSAAGGAELPLYLGPRFDVAAVGRLVAFNIVAPLFLGLCGLVLFVIIAVMRYRRRPVVTAPAQAPPS